MLPPCSSYLKARGVRSCDLFCSAAEEDRLNQGIYSRAGRGEPEEELEIKLPPSTFLNHSAKRRMSILQHCSWLPFCLIKAYQTFNKMSWRGGRGGVGGVAGADFLPFATVINVTLPFLIF